jgi:hypothetical protein
MSLIDERFLMHRLRSSSAAGIAVCILAILAWYYRYAFSLTFIAIKWSLMLWYRLTD